MQELKNANSESRETDWRFKTETFRESPNLNPFVSMLIRMRMLSSPAFRGRCLSLSSNIDLSSQKLYLKKSIKVACEKQGLAVRPQLDSFENLYGFARLMKQRKLALIPTPPPQTFAKNAWGAEATASKAVRRCRRDPGRD